MIYTKVWTDTWFETLPTDAKLLWLFLLVHPNLGRCGIIEFSARLAEFHTGIPTARVTEIIRQFDEAGKIITEGNYVWLPNFMAYQRYNANSREGAAAEAQGFSDKCPKLAERAEKTARIAKSKVLSDPNADAGSDDSESLPNDSLLSYPNPILTQPNPSAAAGTASAVVTAPVSLADLESKLPEAAQGAWADMKQSMATHRRAKLQDRAVISLLTEWLASIEKHQLTPAQVEYGIRACWRAEPPAENERYFRKAALGYRPEPLGAGATSPQERYYTGPPPVDTRTPVQIQAEKLGWQIGQPVLVGGVSMGIFDGKEIVPE